MQQEIQGAKGGHDSEEDARACIGLLKLKEEHGELSSNCSIAHKGSALTMQVPSSVLLTSSRNPFSTV